MNPQNSAILCKCQIYHRLDDEKLTQVIQALKDAGEPLRITEDLCHDAVHHPEKLRDADVIIGCHPRTLQALCDFAGKSDQPTVFDVNHDVEKLLDTLTATASGNVATSSEDTVPRDWIAWYPVIDSDRCVDCGKCADFCMFGVYAINEEKVKVVKPSGCKTDCPACARMCPANAIIFPKSTESNINGALDHVVKPDARQNESLRARLQSRKAASRLFKEDVK